ncbi:MAG: prolyl oligopeptidase family serine peptidase [Candidatus Eisenbacteria bacterium]|uniref:Prolyl oligopeptidase family serine peptidase n=1 Tax=Eiseniibacteriota bacterium TaxID=2212470 RepID=A0A948W4Y9_UNCEI|nr:prolyl oligopeptidase family serine peptidase [Candidatus Eisenbacteria bacterium]MBU1951236.1 prolyl oligopeptidase family serine peptidase [Candidatus Eisenbacteria bacterium]MBU2692752.1 prolyl oligopeptidase family serine peptidase [Candidatus Eisenbacteria bacterium]
MQRPLFSTISFSELIPKVLFFSLFTILLTGSSMVSAGAPITDSSEDGYYARFRDREIDLEPFLLGYPFSGAKASLEDGRLLYFETTPKGKWLRIFKLKGNEEINLTKGRRVGDTDWSTRSWWDEKFHQPTNMLYISSDEKNDEHMNVYALNLMNGEIKQITHNDYTYAWAFSDDDRYLAYISRSGLHEPFNSCLWIRDMETGAERKILCDNGGEDRFTWSHIAFTADNSSVILTIQHDGDRRILTPALIRLDNPSFDYLLPPRVVRYGFSLLEEWVTKNEFLYVSSESGFKNLYLFELEKRESKQLTFYDEDIRTARLMRADGPIAFIIIRRPYESEIHLMDIRTGRRLYCEVINASVDLNDAYKNGGILSLYDLTSSLRLEWFGLRRNGENGSVVRSPMASMPEDLRRKLDHCNVERISYPTFDKAKDGSQRMLHAFYLEPKNPPENPEDRLVLITAFYGGGNYFDKKSHILGAAGIASLSPAPRGGDGFGAEFSALNDGDLGGDEIIDIFYAARWLMKEKGYKAHQIGVHGGSHGGYATMRCMTFPPETNGRNEDFDFGFGISHAGFSDILTFYDSCNIPDWVLLEAGDPFTERAKLADRSPINHVDKLRAPILLTHGKNDWRVPVQESRRFVEAASALGKPVTYIEFEGQGHGIGGLDNLMAFYQGMFDFLESLDNGSR